MPSFLSLDLRQEQGQKTKIPSRVLPVAFLKISILGVKNILDLLQLTETVRVCVCVCERERERERE